jgi:hypothetical protein
MKFEITLIDEDARLAQSVFTYLGINDVENQNKILKHLLFKWLYKKQHEMARSSKERCE